MEQLREEKDAESGGLRGRLKDFETQHLSAQALNGDLAVVRAELESLRGERERERRAFEAELEKVRAESDQTLREERESSGAQILKLGKQNEELSSEWAQRFSKLEEESRS